MFIKGIARQGSPGWLTEVDFVENLHGLATAHRDLEPERGHLGRSDHASGGAAGIESLRGRLSTGNAGGTPTRRFMGSSSGFAATH